MSSSTLGKFISIGVAAAWLIGAGLLVSGGNPEPLLAENRFHAAPFESGERIRFEINWKPLFLFPAFKAGEVTMTLEESSFNGIDTYRISGEAISDGMLSRVAGVEIRNFYESQIDRRDFRSYRLIERTRQGERKRDVELDFDYGRNRVVLRETDPSVDPPKPVRRQTFQGIPAPATDILSAFYVGRLPVLDPGREYTLHLNNRGEFDRVRLAVEGLERIRTPLGRFETVKLATRGGLFRDGGDFRIWYSRDGRRIPVRFEADVKYGKVYGQIIAFHSGSVAKGIIRVN
ncbi:MAG TPA: DUF3108 domain-containing protein [Acidobacteriota bacterium]|nr:DUF3108 domain-containing protein [Acidobacteriota bacterium]